MAATVSGGGAVGLFNVVSLQASGLMGDLL